MHFFSIFFRILQGTVIILSLQLYSISKLAVTILLLVATLLVGSLLHAYATC